MTWQHWLKGLAAAFIGGTANAITLIVVDPLNFNFSTGFTKLMTTAVVSGLLNAAFYLKQSPVPSDKE